MAMLIGGANEVSKSIDQNANKVGGDSNPMPITMGKAFEVAASWEDHADLAGIGHGHVDMGEEPGFLVEVVAVSLGHLPDDLVVGGIAARRGSPAV